MNLDDSTIYVFVRQDIPLAQQLVQTAHASYHAGMDFATDEAGIPFMCVIGMPNLNAMNRVVTKLKASEIRFHAFSDTDVEEGVTAIATAPLDKLQKQALQNYRLWRHVPAVAQAAALDGEAGAKADVAQAVEHSVLNGEVAGAAPAVSSKFNCS